MIGCAAAEQCEIWQAVGEGAVFWKGRWEFCLDEAGPFLAGPADEEIGALRSIRTWLQVRMRPWATKKPVPAKVFVPSRRRMTVAVQRRTADWEPVEEITRGKFYPQIYTDERRFLRRSPGDKGPKGPEGPKTEGRSRSIGSQAD
jgi:hypothetical protein